MSLTTAEIQAQTTSNNSLQHLFLKLDGELVNRINDKAKQIEEVVDTDSHRTSFFALKINNQITSFNS